VAEDRSSAARAARRAQARQAAAAAAKAAAKAMRAAAEAEADEPPPHSILTTISSMPPLAAAAAGSVVLLVSSLVAWQWIRWSRLRALKRIEDEAMRKRKEKDEQLVEAQRRVEEAWRRVERELLRALKNEMAERDFTAMLKHPPTLPPVSPSPTTLDTVPHVNTMDDNAVSHGDEGLLAWLWGRVWKPTASSSMQSTSLSKTGDDDDPGHRSSWLKHKACCDSPQKRSNSIRSPNTSRTRHASPSKPPSSIHPSAVPPDELSLRTLFPGSPTAFAAYRRFLSDCNRLAAGCNCGDSNCDKSVVLIPRPTELFLLLWRVRERNLRAMGGGGGGGGGVGKESGRQKSRIAGKYDAQQRKARMKGGMDFERGEVIVMAAWERTMVSLTQHHSPNPCLTTQSLLESLLTPSDAQSCQQLFSQYYPLETSPHMTSEVKAAVCEEWWTRMLALVAGKRMPFNANAGGITETGSSIVAPPAVTPPSPSLASDNAGNSPVTRSRISSRVREVCESGLMRLRPGAMELLSQSSTNAGLCSRYHVPFLLFSSAVHDLVEEILLAQGEYDGDGDDDSSGIRIHNTNRDLSNHPNANDERRRCEHSMLHLFANRIQWSESSHSSSLLPTNANDSMHMLHEWHALVSSNHHHHHHHPSSSSIPHPASAQTHTRQLSKLLSSNSFSIPTLPSRRHSVSLSDSRSRSRNGSTSIHSSDSFSLLHSPVSGPLSPFTPLPSSVSASMSNSLTMPSHPMSIRRGSLSSAPHSLSNSHVVTHGDCDTMPTAAATGGGACVGFQPPIIHSRNKCIRTLLNAQYLSSSPTSMQSSVTQNIQTVEHLAMEPVPPPCCSCPVPSYPSASSPSIFSRYAHRRCVILLGQSLHDVNIPRGWEERTRMQRMENKCNHQPQSTHHTHHRHACSCHTQSTAHTRSQHSSSPYPTPSLLVPPSPSPSPSTTIADDAEWDVDTDGRFDTIRVGFLHERVEERLDAYKCAFDILVLHDGSMSIVSHLLRFLHAETDTILPDAEGDIDVDHLA